jgi:hypothetical protein
MSYVYFYRVSGFSDCFSTPADAVSFARNMGLEGRIVCRAYRVISGSV